jgi:hypothetical protein
MGEAKRRKQRDPNWGKEFNTIEKVRPVAAQGYQEQGRGFVLIQFKHGSSLSVGNVDLFYVPRDTEMPEELLSCIDSYEPESQAVVVLGDRTRTYNYATILNLVEDESLGEALAER